MITVKFQIPMYDPGFVVISFVVNNNNTGGNLSWSRYDRTGKMIQFKRVCKATNYDLYRVLKVADYLRTRAARLPFLEDTEPTANTIILPTFDNNSIVFNSMRRAK